MLCFLVPVLFPIFLSLSFFFIFCGLWEKGKKLFCIEGKFWPPSFCCEGKFWFPSLGSEGKFLVPLEIGIFNTGSGSRAQFFLSFFAQYLTGTWGLARVFFLRFLSNG